MFPTAKQGRLSVALIWAGVALQAALADDLAKNAEQPLFAAPPVTSSEQARRAQQSPGPAGAGPFPIDLPTALRLANATNPTIALARERVQEAYYRLRQAQASWLPDLHGGPTYLRHDGQVQNSQGRVFTTSKESLFVHGDPAVGWDVSNVLFGPLVARQLVNAQAAAAQGITDNIQLEAALAYLELLRVFGAQAINADTLSRAEEMLRNAEAADKAGLGKTPADVNRARTEVSLRREERIILRGQAAVASARLARLLLLPPTVDLYPIDPTIVPITLVPPEVTLEQLVAAGLRNRPELRQGQALAEASRLRWREAKVSPLLPRIEVGYSAGLFGGGLNDQLSNFNGRGNGYAQAIWELNSLGVGDLARARARRSEVDQANWYVVEVQAQVAEEVTVAAKLSQTRLESLTDAQDAVKQALETWRRLRAAAFGLAGAGRRYDPLEPLIAERDLDQARTRYLHEVIGYNTSQFRLYWALGQPPLCAVSGATAISVEVPVVPSVPPPTLPPPRRLGEQEHGGEKKPE